MPESLPNNTTVSHYRIVSHLGTGGMGEVYLAEDTRLNRKVALKVLPENFAADNERLRRFEQEARAASALNHPSILTVYEFGFEQDIHFLATELIEGKTLREIINSGELSLSETLNIAEQTAFALSAAHAAGIVHRDLKPENIMIRHDGIVKVLDFGLAKLIEKKEVLLDNEAATRALVQTKAGVVMGTVGYMSPEQAKGKETDERTDIWSFGVVLYEMICSEMPFTGETANDIIASILKSEPMPISHHTSSVPKELERIIGKTLRKNREERYQHIKDLWLDLKDLKQDLEFQNKLERTTPPNREESKTQILNATTADVAHTTSSAEYIASGIKNHKRGFALGLIVLLLALVGSGYWYYAQRSTKQIESIAVLPFVNEGGSADTEYLSDGMTETLISSLSQIPKLNVKARSSVFRYKGKETDAQTVGKELNVQALLIGRVVQRGSDLVLYVELVDAVTENSLWKQTYNKTMTNLVALQSDIAYDVTNKLKVKISGTDEQKLAKNYTENNEAYQFYLKGRFYWYNRSPDGFRKAIEYFKQAIAIDPNYALAYTGLADSYSLLPIYDRNVKATETMPQAKEAALKALSLDDNLAEAHASLGVILDIFDYDWVGSEQHYRRAIQLNPNAPSPHQWLGEMLVNIGRFDEGLAEGRRAIELDPFSLIANMTLGVKLNSARRYDEAIIQLQKTLALDPNFADVNYFLFEAYANKKMYAEAVAAYVKQKELDGDPITEIEAMKAAFAKSGWQGFLRHRISYLEAQPRVFPDELAGYYARVGDKDKAIASLEKAYKERNEGLTFLKVDARYDNLRDDPRFQDLLRRVGFTP